MVACLLRLTRGSRDNYTSLHDTGDAVAATCPEARETKNRMKRLGLWASIALSVAAFAFLYRAVIAKLVYDWVNDGNYSHGFLIVPVAAYLVWERRKKLTATPIRPNVLGLVLLVGSLATLTAGILGAELFLSRVSMIGVIGGAVLFTTGWRYLRVLMFPLAFLLLMIPIPAIIFNEIAFPLQLLASRCAEWTLSTAHIPVLREGNIIVLANTTLEVAEACSGIRSLISLVTLAIIYGYFTDDRVWARVVLTLAAVPVAVATLRRDLRAFPGFARACFNDDRAVVNLRYFLLEQAHHQLGGRSRDHHARTLARFVHRLDNAPNAIADAIVLKP